MNRPARTIAVPGALLAALALLSPGFAQRVAVSVSDSVVPGGHLVDTYGRSLYLNVNEEAGESTCTGECAAAWPPLRVRGTPSAGEGVDASLLGTVERDDGTMQLTYNGWPLYYFSGDTGSGDYLGQAAEERWYLVSPAGEPLTEVAPPETPVAEEPAGQPEGDAAEAEQPAAAEGQAPAPEQEAAAGVDPEVMAQGAQNYASVCATCHGQNGQGGAGVRLVGNSRLTDPTRVARVIVHGFGYMPAVGRDQSDEWVAAVATYVRNSWGNDFGPVTPEEVESVR